MDAEEDSDAEADIHLPEEDLQLPDPVKDHDAGMRQSTFRGNAIAWIRSKPAGRLLTLRKILRAQQECQRMLIEASSQGSQRAELKRRIAGEPPSFSVVKAAEGGFHTQTLRDWTALMQKESEWQCLPEQHKTHELSIQSFRAL